MRTKKRFFVSDFETTVYLGQTRTDVWASASVELFTEDVQIFHSLLEQFEYFKSLKSDLVVYYHNLKFDGSFWLDFLMNSLHLKQAVFNIKDSDYSDEIYPNKDKYDCDWYVDFMDVKDMPANTFIYSISDMGTWYKIIVKVGQYYIEIRDSLKLLPFSVREIGKSFKTKHKKLDMKYTGFRYPGCEITDKEKEYIANDVLVVKEAIEFMFTEGHKKLTIGSCCLSEFIQSISVEDYHAWFPNIYDMSIKECTYVTFVNGKPTYTDDHDYGAKTAGDYVHKSYRGGWCYLVRGKENKVFRNGTTADVNSLYPSVMSSESGSYYPIGRPRFSPGKVPEYMKQDNDFYFFVRVKTRFYLKKDKLPFIQIKNSYHYRSTEMLETSDVYDKTDGKYKSKIVDFNGEVIPATVTMVMTKPDYILFHEHYDVMDYEELDYCWFHTDIGIFDKYIEKYKKIKIESTGAMRTLAKLFLNNLYGKMATSPDSSYKYVYIDDQGRLAYRCIHKRDKKPGYIPVGSAITSYARCFTIRAAQLNYYGRNKPGFIYADTDSIHLDLPPDKIRGITEHPTNFCCWKLESNWDTAIFVRQKTYIEHVIKEDGNVPKDGPYYSIRCAGMPQRCKTLFELSMTQPDEAVFTQAAKDFDYTDEELDFAHTPRKLTDFKAGIKIPGKLVPRRIPGGTLLTPIPYEMR